MENNKMLCAKISLHAGGGWEGHTFFMAECPITNKSTRSNFIFDIENFCKKNNLFFDRDFMDQVISKLAYDIKYGWLVPKEKLEKHIIVTSAQRYLNEIQKDLF